MDTEAKGKYLKEFDNTCLTAVAKWKYDSYDIISALYDQKPEGSGSTETNNAIQALSCDCDGSKDYIIKILEYSK